MRREPRFVLLLVLALLLGLFGIIERADAQTFQNPTTVAFTPSSDHALVTTYELGYFAVAATAPTQTASVAKSALTAAGTDYRFTFPRLLFGAYDIKLRACAGASCSAWVAADRSVEVTPFPPTVVRVQ